MALFCSAIRKDSVSHLKNPFPSHVQVFLREILLGCRLKCQFSCFSPIFFQQLLFCFLCFPGRHNPFLCCFYAVFEMFYCSIAARGPSKALAFPRPQRSCKVQRSPRNDSLLWTVLPLQHLTHVRPAVRASNRIDTSLVNHNIPS